MHITAYIRSTWQLSNGKFWKAEEINTDLIDNLNISFANINKEGKAFLNNKEYIKEQVLQLKKNSPNLHVNLSIGGWGEAGFSNACSNQKNRDKFCKSVEELLKDIPFAGVDIDWEFPVGPDWGQAIPCSPADKENYIQLLSDLRKMLNQLGQKTNESYSLTTAIPSVSWFPKKIDVQAVSMICDALMVMNYDYYGSWSETTGHNANLYDNPQNPRNWSSDQEIKILLACGVPSEKIIFGIPFYTLEWAEVPDINNGLFQKPGKFSGTFDQTDFSRYEEGFTDFWDEKSCASYKYNPEKKIFVSYTSSKMIEAIGKYVKDYNLGGAMYWEYGNDMKSELLSILNRSVK